MRQRQFLQIGGDDLGIAVGKDHADPMIMLEFYDQDHASVQINNTVGGLAQFIQYPAVPIQVVLTPEQATALVTKLRWALALSPKPKVEKKPAKKAKRR